MISICDLFLHCAYLLAAGRGRIFGTEVVVIVAASPAAAEAAAAAAAARSGRMAGMEVVEGGRRRLVLPAYVLVGTGCINILSNMDITGH